MGAQNTGKQCLFNILQKGQQLENPEEYEKRKDFSKFSAGIKKWNHLGETHIYMFVAKSHHSRWVGVTFPNIYIRQNTLLLLLFSSKAEFNYILETTLPIIIKIKHNLREVWTQDSTHFKDLVIIFVRTKIDKVSPGIGSEFSLEALMNEIIEKQKTKLPGISIFHQILEVSSVTKEGISELESTIKQVFFQIYPPPEDH